MRGGLKSEADLSNRVSKFVSSKFGCDSITELKVGSCKFDVVGFNRAENCFYIVESKLGSKPTTIGHAFGQSSCTSQ